MAKVVRVPIPAKGQPQLTFPGACVGCGAPAEAESTLAIARLVASGGRQRKLELKYQVPHCQRCARATKAVFLAGCVPFVLGFLLAGGLAFAVVGLGALRLGLEDYAQPNTSPSLVLGAAAGLFGGLAGGFLLEVLARPLLLPFFGRPLLRAPLLASQLLSDSDHVAGLTGRLDRDGTTLLLAFERDEAARELLDRSPAASPA